MSKPNRSSRDGKSSGKTSRTGDRILSSSTRKGRESRYPENIMEHSTISNDMDYGNDMDYARYNDPPQNYSSSQDYQPSQDYQGGQAGGHQPLEAEDYEASHEYQSGQGGGHPRTESQNYQLSQDYEPSPYYQQPSQGYQSSQQYQAPQEYKAEVEQEYQTPQEYQAPQAYQVEQEYQTPQEYQPAQDDHPATETLDPYLKPPEDPFAETTSHIPPSSRERDRASDPVLSGLTGSTATHQRGDKASHKNAGSSKGKGHAKAGTSSHSTATVQSQHVTSRGYQRERPDDKPSQPSSKHGSTSYEPGDQPGQASGKQRTTSSKQHKDSKSSKRDYKPLSQDSQPSNQGLESSNQHYEPPIQGYEPPIQSYEPTIQDYEPPREHSSTSNQNYQPSNQGFEPSTQHYEPPIQGYEPSKQHYSTSPMSSHIGEPKGDLRRSGPELTKSRKDDQRRKDADRRVSQLEQEMQEAVEKSRRRKEQLVNEQNTSSGLRAEVSRLQSELERARLLQEELSRSRDYELRQNADQIYKYDSRISQLEAEKIAMSEALQTSETNKMQLSQQVSSLDADRRRIELDFQNLKKKRDDKRKEIGGLTEALNAAETRLQDVSKEKSDLEHRSAKLAQQVVEAQSAAKKAHQRENVQAKSCQSLQEELGRLNSEIDSSRLENSQLYSQLKQQDNELAEAKYVATNLSQIRATETEQLHNLQEELVGLRSEVQAARSSNDKLSGEREQQRQALIRAEYEAAEGRRKEAVEADKSGALRYQVASLKAEAQKAREEISKLTSRLEHNGKELARARNMGNKKETIETGEARELQLRVDSLKWENQEAREEISRLTSQLEQIGIELAQARNIGTRKEAIETEECRKLQFKVDSLTLKNHQAQSEISKLTRQLEQQKEKLTDEKKTNDTGKIRELSVLVQRMEMETKSSRDEVSELTKQMERKKFDLERAFRVARDLEAREEKARDQLERSEKERSVLTERLKLLEKTLEGSRGQERRPKESDEQHGVVRDLEAREKKARDQLEKSEKERWVLAERLKRLEKTLEDSRGQERARTESDEQHQSDLEKEIVDLRSEIKDLHDREYASKESFQENTDAWEKTRDILRQTLQQSIDRATTFEAEVAKLGRQLAEARTQRQSLQQASPQTLERQHSLQMLQEELERSQNESGHLNKVLKEREVALKGELNKVQSQLDHSHRVISDLESKLKESAQRHDGLDNQISQLRGKLKTDVQSRREEEIRWKALIADSQSHADSERKRANGLIGQLQQLKEAAESMSLQLEAQRLEKLDTQSHLDTYRSNAAKLEAAKRKLEVKAESDKKTIESLKATNRALANGVRDMANQQLMNQVEQCREVINQLRYRIGEQENLLKVQDAYISKVQTVAWERVKDTTKEKSKVIDDDALAAKFQVEVQSRAQQWAIKYASREPDLVWTPDSIQDIGSELEKVTGQRDPVVFCRRYETDLIVHALLSHFVTEHILQRPFLIFEFQDGPEVAELMASIYRAKLKADPTAAYKWRYSQLWQGASSQPYPAKTSPSATPAVLQQNNPINETYFNNLAIQFVNGPAKVLLNKGAFSTSAIQTIMCILLNAAQAALWMWRHPTEIQIREFDQLKGLQCSLAEDGNGVAETHRRQTGPAASRPRRPDAVVDMVVQPAIVAARKNRVEKVWSRGVVLWN